MACALVPNNAWGLCMCRSQACAHVLVLQTMTHKPWFPPWLLASNISGIAHPTWSGREKKGFPPCGKVRAWELFTEGHIRASIMQESQEFYHNSEPLRCFNVLPGGRKMCCAERSGSCKQPSPHGAQWQSNIQWQYQTDNALPSCQPVESSSLLLTPVRACWSKCTAPAEGASKKLGAASSSMDGSCAMTALCSSANTYASNAHMYVCVHVWVYVCVRVLNVWAHYTCVLACAGTCGHTEQMQS